MSKLLDRFIKIVNSQSKLKEDFKIKYDFIIREFNDKQSQYLKNIFFEENNKLEFSKKFNIDIEIFNKINEMIENQTSDASNEIKILENKIKELIIKDVNISYILPLLGYFYIARLNNNSINNVEQDKYINVFDKIYLINWFIEKCYTDDIDDESYNNIIDNIENESIDYLDGLKLLSLYCIYKNINPPIKFNLNSTAQCIYEINMTSKSNYDFYLWALKYFYKNNIDISEQLEYMSVFLMVSPLCLKVLNENSNFIIKYLEENINSNKKIIKFTDNIFQKMLDNKFPFPNKNSNLYNYMENNYINSIHKM